MADRKISDLASQTNANLASGDLIHTVDISEPNNADKNKSLTIGELDKRYYRSGYVAATTTYTAGVGDNFIACNTVGGAFTVTLPSAAGVAGRMIKVQKANADLNKLTVDGSGSETLGGQASVFLLGHDETISLVSDGTNWRITDWDAGQEIITTNSLGEENNISDNVLKIRYQREFMLIEEMFLVWDGGGGTSAILAWEMPGGFSIDTTRGAGGTTTTNADASVFGVANIFTTAWFIVNVQYNTTTSFKFTAGGANYQYSSFAAGRSIRARNTIKVPIA